jgi:hypothetical protein
VHSLARGYLPVNQYVMAETACCFLETSELLGELNGLARRYMRGFADMYKAEEAVPADAGRPRTRPRLKISVLMGEWSVSSRRRPASGITLDHVRVRRV